MTDPDQTNLWASIHKENSRVLPARLQVVRLVYHPIKLEAGLPWKVKNLGRTVISGATWKIYMRVKMFQKYRWVVGQWLLALITAFSILLLITNKHHI